MASAALPPGKGRFIHDSMNDPRAKRIELFEAERLPPKDIRPPIIEEAFKDVFERLDAVPEGDSESPVGHDQSSALPPQSEAGRLARVVGHIIPTHSMIGEGARGAPVAEIQRFLGARGMIGGDGRSLPVNGVFDDATRAAVEAYQMHHPTLFEDGIVGLRTLATMLRDEASTKPVREAKAAIAGGGLNATPRPKADASRDRGLQLAYELGERLGRSHWPGGRAGDVDFGFGFKPSPETGAIDPDALEVSTAITVPRSIDRGLPFAALERDAAIIYMALRGLDDARPR